MTKILIAGATGHVGSRVLQQALVDPRVSHVVALTRRPVTAHEKLENIIPDFDNLPEEASFWAVDGVVCALGSTRAKVASRAQFHSIDYGYPMAIARRALDHKATRFALTSSLSANPKSRIFYSKMKGELERDLTALNYPSLTIFRPSVLGGARAEIRRGERFGEHMFQMLKPLLPSRLRVTDSDLLAAALLNAAIAGPMGRRICYNQDMG